jgi:hypothetical protein
VLEVLGFVRGAEHVRVGRIGLLGAHVVREPGLFHVVRHLAPATQFIDERLIEPRLVDAQARIGQQAVAVEPLDIVPLEGAAVPPDIDVVFLHRNDEHRAGDGAADGRGVEVGHTGRRDVEGAGLECGDAFLDELLAAVDQPREFGPVLERLAGNLFVVGFVRLAEVGGVRKRNRAFVAHPMQGRTGIETTGKRDADFLADGKTLKDVSHDDAPNGDDTSDGGWGTTTTATGYGLRATNGPWLPDREAGAHPAAGHGDAGDLSIALIE